MKSKIAAALVAAALIAGGGAFALTRLMAPAQDAAIEYVPAGAVGYMNVFIRPSNSQKQALDELLQKFPGIDSTDDAIEKLIELADEGLAEGGMSYEEDLEPWLGDQVAAFVTEGGTEELPNFAFLVESKDDDAAQDFVEKLAEEDDVALEDKTYEGETYQMEEGGGDPVAVAILDGFLVVGSEDAIKDVVDTRAGGETLADDEQFVEATDPLEDDWIGLFYFDLGGFLAEYGEAAGFGVQEKAAFEALGLGEEAPQAAILYAQSDSVTFESSGGFGLNGGFGELTELVADEGLVPDLPRDTWAAYGVPNFGAFFDGLFETFESVPGGVDREQLDAMFYGQTGLRLQEDVLSWMEDAGLFVEGTNIQSIGGGLVIESNDPDKTARLLEKIEEVVTQQGVRTRPESAGDLEGFSVRIPGAPAPVYALAGDRLVVGYGDAALDAATDGETLRDSEAFAAAQEAVGDDFNIAFYLDVDGAQEFGETVAAFTGVPMETYEQDVKPYVDVLTHVVTAAKMDGDTIVQKFLIGVE